MFKTQPFTTEFDFKPNFQFYRMQPLDGNLTGSSTSDKQKSSINTSLDMKQQALIKSLEAFNIKADAYIQEFGGIDKQPGNKSAEKKTDKKTDKKTNKSQATQANKSSEKTADLAKLEISAIKSKARVSYSGLEAQIDPFGYETKEFSATLQCQEKDRQWLEIIQKLGQKKGIVFGENPSGSRTVKVEFVKSTPVQLSCNLFTDSVRGRIVVWKTLGVLFGLFDFFEASLVGQIHQWLRCAEDLLEGRQKPDKLVREACQRLSAHDFLAANDIPSLADYIVYSMISNTTYLPNNVELWANRIQK